MAVQRREFNSLLVAGGSVAVAGCASAPQRSADCSPPSANGLTEKDLRDYFDAFNRSDFAGFSKYYDENVIFQGRGRDFRNRQQIVDFYTEVKKRLRETIKVNEVIVGEQGIAAEVETELYAFQDWPELVTGAIRKGETVLTQNFIWYEVRNAKFVHIRSARYRKLI